MEIEDKYLSADNCEEGDIITFVDEGSYSEMRNKDGSTRKVLNFKVNNGRYEQLYTPGVTAQKILMKAFGRETSKWIGQKFQIKFIEQLSYGKSIKIILPNVVVEEQPKLTL